MILLPLAPAEIELPILPEITLPAAIEIIAERLAYEASILGEEE